jgi:prepilin-type N-terminal cleavage/methylation domain-containing protein
MSTRWGRKHPMGWHVVPARIAKLALCEKAFSMAELMAVITIIGVVVTGATIMWTTTAHGTDVRAAAEMLKEDLRKAYSMAALGASNGKDSTGIIQRDKYKFQINTSTGSPASTYRIQTCTWDPNAGAYTAWALYPTRKSQANKIDSSGWIQPGSSCQLSVLSGGGEPLQVTSYEFTFTSRGSMVQKDPAGDTTIRVSNEAKHVDVTVSMYGDVS